MEGGKAVSEVTFAKAQRMGVVSEVRPHGVLSAVQVSRCGLRAPPRETPPPLTTAVLLPETQGDAGLPG